MTFIDLDAARRFLTALTGEISPVMCWQTFDDRKERKKAADRDPLAHVRHGTLDDLAPWLTQLNGELAGVYVTINRTDGKGRKEENVTGLRALFVDGDGAGPLPTSWAIDPAIVVQRDDTHWHAYWLLVDGEDLTRFSLAQTQLAAALGTDLKVKDLPRVLRVPGFAHCKAEPRAVTLITANGAAPKHTIDALLAAFPVANWEALSDACRRAGHAVGLCAAPPMPARTAVAPAPARMDQLSRYDKAFIAWASKKETGAGSANPHGGQDNAAFIIAAEGYGRVHDGHLSGDWVVIQAVSDYLQRCNYADVPRETDRICHSAASKPRRGNAIALNDKPAAVNDRRQPVNASGPDVNNRGDRLAQTPTSGEDLFGNGSPAPSGAGGGDEGGKPPAAVAGAEDPHDGQGAWGGLDKAKLASRWSISRGGVFPIETTMDGSLVVRFNKRVSGLPIWPERSGRDVASGGTWWKLGWLTPQNKTEYQWVSEYDLKMGHPLISLPNAPVAKRQAENCAVYLTEARAAVTQAPAEVTSRIGWCGINGARRWVFPGVGASQGIEYIGGALPAHGSIEGWKTGLAYLLSDDMPGTDGYTALAVVCLSAASPWSRLMGARNPIIGLMGPSSSGKGSAIDYALAMWADADLMRLPASSTSKGIQDRAVQLPDLPIMLDELQQLTELHPQATADALYFLANGQRRTTSSKNQVAVGGERRFGVGFYAAEAPVLPGQNLGVLYRVIELGGAPCPNEATAKALQAGTRHTGTLAGPIAAVLGAKDVTAWITEVHARAAVLRAEMGGLTGDDPEALALIELGAEVLGQVTGLALPVTELVEWLAGRIRTQRANVVDRETQCLIGVMSAVLNQTWTDSEWDADAKAEIITKKTTVALQGRPLAWRKWARPAEEGEALSYDALEIDPQHREIAPLFLAGGGQTRLLKQWADRGWCERQGGHNTVKKSGCIGSGGRVVRFTAAAWKVFDGPEVAVPT